MFYRGGEIDYSILSNEYFFIDIYFIHEYIFHTDFCFIEEER